MQLKLIPTSDWFARPTWSAWELLKPWGLYHPELFSNRSSEWLYHPQHGLEESVETIDNKKNRSRLPRKNKIEATPVIFLFSEPHIGTIQSKPKTHFSLFFFHDGKRVPALARNRPLAVKSLWYIKWIRLGSNVSLEMTFIVVLGLRFGFSLTPTPRSSSIEKQDYNVTTADRTTCVCSYGSERLATAWARVHGRRTGVC